MVQMLVFCLCCLLAVGQPRCPIACIGVWHLLYHHCNANCCIPAAVAAFLLPTLDAMQPIMLGDAALANKMAAAMLEKGVYVVGFSYPVVPKGTARIRVQLSAAHEREHLDKAITAFKDVGKQLGVIQ
jgi:hypothetical protein